MSATLEAPPSTHRAQPVVLCVVVAVVVVVGWVLYRHYAYPHVLERALRRQVVSDRFWLANLVQAMLLSLPYALVLLLWGRGLAKAATAATAAVATGLFAWGWPQVFVNVVWDHGPPSHTSFEVFEWGYLVVVAVLVPLCWGLARRHGRAWVAGLAVGPAVAAALRELQLHGSWWQARVTEHWPLQAVVYVAPFVLGALACWALDTRENAQPRPDRG